MIFTYCTTYSQVSSIKHLDIHTIHVCIRMYIRICALLGIACPLRKLWKFVIVFRSFDAIFHVNSCYSSTPVWEEKGVAVCISNCSGRALEFTCCMNCFQYMQFLTLLRYVRFALPFQLPLINSQLATYYRITFGQRTTNLQTELDFMHIAQCGTSKHSPYM